MPKLCPYQPVRELPRSILHTIIHFNIPTSYPSLLLLLPKHQLRHLGIVIQHGNSPMQQAKVRTEHTDPREPGIDRNWPHFRHPSSERGAKKRRYRHIATILASIEELTDLPNISAYSYVPTHRRPEPEPTSRASSVYGDTGAYRKCTNRSGQSCTETGK